MIGVVPLAAEAPLPDAGSLEIVLGILTGGVRSQVRHARTSFHVRIAASASRSVSKTRSAPMTSTSR